MATSFCESCSGRLPRQACPGCGRLHRPRRVEFSSWAAALGALAAFALLAGCAGGPVAPMPAATLCEVAENPDPYYGKPMLVRARYATNLGEYAYLYSGSCKGVAAEVFPAPDGGGKSLSRFQKFLVDECDVPIKAYCPMEFEVVALVRFEPSSDPGYQVRAHLLDVNEYGRIMLSNIDYELHVRDAPAIRRFELSLSSLTPSTLCLSVEAWPNARGELSDGSQRAVVVLDNGDIREAKDYNFGYCPGGCGMLAVSGYQSLSGQIAYDAIAFRETGEESAPKQLRFSVSPERCER